MNAESIAYTALGNQQAEPANAFGQIAEPGRKQPSKIKATEFAVHAQQGFQWSRQQ